MESNFSFESENVFQKISDYAGGNLRQSDDVKLLIDTAFKQNKIQLLEELSFHAKFSDGLLRVIQRRDSTIDEVYFLKAVDEFQDSIKKVVEILTELLGGATGFIQSIFSEKYFQLSQSSLANLNSLCSDLSFLKLYFNDIKSKNT